MQDRDHLLQEDHVTRLDGPWRILIVCQCLNMTTWMQAEPFLDWFFKVYPTSERLLEINCTDAEELQEKLRPLGMQEKRYGNILVMTAQYRLRDVKLFGDYKCYNVMEFKGCGQYAEDAWTLFVLKKPCSPKDRLLRQYAEREGLLS